MSVTTAPPAAIRPAKRRLSRRAGLVLVAAAATLAVCVAGSVVVGWSRAIDKGADCAPCAAFDWVTLTSPQWPDADGKTRVSKDLAGARRAALLKQRQQFIGAMRADAADNGGAPPSLSSADDVHPARTQVTGDGATVVVYVKAVWPLTGRTGAQWIESGALPWRFEVRHDRPGWRIWAATMPAWCGGYSRCGAKPATPVPSPSDTSRTTTVLWQTIPIPILKPLLRVV